MSKSFKKAISLVFKVGDKVLVLKRSPDKASFPSAWSLPSTYVQDGESLEATSERLVKRKLGIDKIVLNKTSIGTSPIVDRGDYDFQMTDYEVTSHEGEIDFNPTEYTDMKWLTPAELLGLIQVENNGKMGECTKTFLRSEKLL